MDKTMTGHSSLRMGSSAAVLVVAAASFSCAGSGRTIELDMYDGWKLLERKPVTVPATTFVLTVFDEGNPHIIDDETWTYYEFAIPDGDRWSLPVTFNNLSGIRTVTGFRSPVSAEFTGGTFTLVRGIPGAFIASYDLGSGDTRVIGQSSVRPIGETRKGIWPYDLTTPTPSLGQRLIRTIKDAWHGAI